ncbi:hypothetical protein HKD37_02G004839 [Glycine soja]
MFREFKEFGKLCYRRQFKELGFTIASGWLLGLNGETSEIHLANFPCSTFISIMDRSWMNESRMSPTYEEGVEHKYSTTYESIYCVMGLRRIIHRGYDMNTHAPMYETLQTDSKKPLYPGCNNSLTLLSTVLCLVNVKVRYGWSDKSFSSLLQVVHDMLPEENMLPKSYYQAKKILCSMASSPSFLSKAHLGGEAPSSMAYSLVDGAASYLFSFVFRCISMLKDPASIEAPQASFHQVVIRAQELQFLLPFVFKPPTRKNNNLGTNMSHHSSSVNGKGTSHKDPLSRILDELSSLKEKHASYSSHNSCKSLSEELRDYYEGRHRSHHRPHSHRREKERKPQEANINLPYFYVKDNVEANLDCEIRVEQQLKEKSTSKSYGSHSYPKKDQGQGILGVIPSKPKDDKGKIIEKQAPKASMQEKTSSIKCFKCLGRGHITSQCPTTKTMIMRGQDIYSSQDEATTSPSSNENEEAIGEESREEIYPQEEGQPLMVKEECKEVSVEGRSPEYEEPWDLRSNPFQGGGNDAILPRKGIGFLSKAHLGGEAPSSMAYSLVDGAASYLFSFVFRCISMLDAVDHRKSDSATNVVLQLDAVTGLTLPPELEVGHSAARVSTKESCVDNSGNDPDTGDSEKCGLYVEENPPHLVSLGRLYEGSTIVHNIPLRHDQVKVGVEEVIPFMYPLKRFSALNTFVAWPTHLVKHLSEHGAMGLVKPADRLNHDVMRDLTVFGVFNDNFPLYIKHEDLSEIAHSGQYLNISVIQLHMIETSMRAGDADVYGFLEPQSIQRSGQSQFESKSYIKKWMQNSKRDVYLGAYLNGADNYLKGIINSALKGFNDTPQSKSKVAARWIVVKYFNDARPLEPKRLKAFHIQWATYYLKVKNETISV